MESSKSKVVKETITELVQKEMIAAARAGNKERKEALLKLLMPLMMHPDNMYLSMPESKELELVESELQKAHFLLKSVESLSAEKALKFKYYISVFHEFVVA